MSYFNIVAETNESTVVTTYELRFKHPEAYRNFWLVKSDKYDLFAPEVHDEDF